MKADCSSADLLAQRWLTRREAASYLRICEVMLDRIIKQGRLPVAKLGRRVLIDRLEIDKRLATGGL
jgi:excisionase family DNA binding protein